MILKVFFSSLLSLLRVQRCNSKVVFYWDQPFLVGWFGWVFRVLLRKKPFSVGLVDQLFQPASN